MLNGRQKSRLVSTYSGATGNEDFTIEYLLAMPYPHV